MHVHDLSYAGDRRVTCGVATQPVLRVWHAETDEYSERELPWHWDVCPVCEGKGTHVNPSIDAHGLTREDFDEDPGFAEDYRAGVYDIPCNHCGGRTTVPVVDEKRCDPVDLHEYREQLEADAQERAEEARALAMGY